MKLNFSFKKIYFSFLKIKNNTGFTLLELTVVTSIILLLTSFFLVNYRGGEREFSLLRSAHKLAQDLRVAQEMAMAGEEFQGAFPKGGYGVYFNVGSNSYILFADCDENKKYEGEISVCPNCLGESCFENFYSEKVEELFLEEKVEISELSPVSPLNTLNITFLPPDPTITIESASNLATITLIHGGKIKTVTINKVGLIDVD